MTSKSVSASSHQHISFTAHYTGYIWYQAGLSHAVFATALGKTLADNLEPWERWHEWWFGNSVRLTLHIRHVLMDAALQDLLRRQPDAQILELACGLSPRGWRFRQEYPGLVYRESDLPEMAAYKQNLLRQIEPAAPDVLTLDVFGDGWDEVAAVLDTDKPLIVLSEGLINYFDRRVLHRLLRKVTAFGGKFSACHYLTDVYPYPLHSPLAMAFWGSSQILKTASNSRFGFHFDTPDEAVKFFGNAGFSRVNITEPHSVPSALWQGKETLARAAQSGDLVWLVAAEV